MSSLSHTGRWQMQVPPPGMSERLSHRPISHNEKMSAIRRECLERQNRLLDAIEQGVASLDEITQNRLQNLKTAREALHIQIAETRITSLPPAIEYLKPSQVELFDKALRKKLLNPDSGLAKGYLNLLVEEIVVNDADAIIRGSYAALAHAMHQLKMGTRNQVPTFICDWRAQHDSNV